MWLDFGSELNRNQNHPPKPKKNITYSLNWLQPILPIPHLLPQSRHHLFNFAASLFGLRPPMASIPPSPHHHWFFPTFTSPYRLHQPVLPNFALSGCRLLFPATSLISTAFSPLLASSPPPSPFSDPSIFSPTLFSNLAAIVDCKLCLFQFLIEFSFHPNRKETDQKFQLVSDRFGWKIRFGSVLHCSDLRGVQKFGWSESSSLDTTISIFYDIPY